MLRRSFFTAVHFFAGRSRLHGGGRGVERVHWRALATTARTGALPVSDGALGAAWVTVTYVEADTGYIFRPNFMHVLNFWSHCTFPGAAWEKAFEMFRGMRSIVSIENVEETHFASSSIK